MNDYEVTLNIHCVPCDDHEELELELYDLLKSVNQLPYDFDLHVKKVGEYL